MIVASTPPPPPGAWKYAMVLITYVACASFHASREAYVAVKGDFQRRLHFPTQLLGLLDTTFLVCYGLGLLFSGSIGARFGNKTVATVGLAGTAAVLAAHGALSKGWLGVLPESADEAWAQGLSLYVPLVALNGVVQSLGFPNLVAVTSGWVAPNQRGVVLGLWSTTGAAGDIIGLNVATAVLEGGLEWQTVFFAVSGYLGVMTIVLWTCVEDRGKKAATGEVTMETSKTSVVPVVGDAGETTKLLSSSPSPPPPPRGNVLSGLAEAWAVPGVLDWSLSYFFIKTVTYTILFWMPYYLTLTLDSQATADNLTVLFDVSMIFGTATLGLVTDRVGGARSPLFVGSFVVGSLPLLFLPALRQSTFHYAAAFVTVGLFSGGPAHMYGTAVSVDLGEAAAAAGAPGLVSSLSGLIDGIGTLGAAVGQSIVARVASEGERSAMASAVAGGGGAGGVAGVSDTVLRGTYVSSGDVAADEAAGFTDATFEMPSGMGVDDNGLPLYVETPEHHAGGEKKGIARIVSDMIAGDAEMQKHLPGRSDVDAATSRASASSLGNARRGLGFSSASLGESADAYAEADVGEVAGIGVARLSDTVDDGFQRRWSRVFFMLFAFNLLAAGTLLRVAAWELRRLGWFGGDRRPARK